jgi:hypothetical protein
MIDRLLTTEELLDELERTSSSSYVNTSNQKKRKKKEYYILWGIVAIAVLHLLLFSLPVIIGVKNTVNLIGQTRVVGIPYVEGNVSQRRGKVIVLNRYDIDKINEGDFVVIYGLEDTQYHWEVEITFVDVKNKTIAASFNGLYSSNHHFDEIEGVYAKDANSFGVILYVSSQWKGLLAAAAVYLSVILIYYVFIIREMKVIEVRKNGRQEI